MGPRPVHRFTKERLAADAALPKEQILEFLEDFQALVHGQEGKRKLISLRVPETLLKAFRAKAEREGPGYQTKIVELMRAWLKS